MKNNKLLDYIHIIITPTIISMIFIILSIYNYFTGKIVQYIPNIYIVSIIIVFICMFFIIYNIIDYKNEKL